jgi:hypothetical protein
MPINKWETNLIVIYSAHWVSNGSFTVRGWSRVLLVPNGCGLGRLLNILQCTGQPSHHKEWSSTKCQWCQGRQTLNCALCHFFLIAQLTSEIYIADRFNLPWVIILAFYSVHFWGYRASLPFLFPPKPYWPIWTSSFLLSFASCKTEIWECNQD